MGFGLLDGNFAPRVEHKLAIALKWSELQTLRTQLQATREAWDRAIEYIRREADARPLAREHLHERLSLVKT